MDKAQIDAAEGYIDLLAGSLAWAAQNVNLPSSIAQLFGVAAAHAEELLDDLRLLGHLSENPLKPKGEGK